MDGDYKNHRGTQAKRGGLNYEKIHADAYGSYRVATTLKWKNRTEMYLLI